MAQRGRTRTRAGRSQPDPIAQQDVAAPPAQAGTRQDASASRSSSGERFDLDDNDTNLDDGAAAAFLDPGATNPAGVGNTMSNAGRTADIGHFFASKAARHKGAIVDACTHCV